MRMAIASLLFLLLMTGTVQADDAAGRAILEKECGSCHAIAVTGDSPLAKAPPFREVVTRYPPENLTESLAEGIVTGHDGMPEFIFEPEEIGDIVAYLETLKPR
ncbi:MAG: cytochrome c [Rhizobiales bacterium]|nr:cytochrome c [Hyphomicrobiales bacterium]